MRKSEACLGIVDWMPWHVQNSEISNSKHAMEHAMACEIEEVGSVKDAMA